MIAAIAALFVASAALLPLPLSQGPAPVARPQTARAPQQAEIGAFQRRSPFARRAMLRKFLRSEEGQALRQEYARRFDADGDGHLSRSERLEARQRIQSKLHSKALERFDTDRDGALSAAERKQAKGEIRSRLLERCDTDRDGRISREERDRAREQGLARLRNGYVRGKQR